MATLLVFANLVTISVLCAETNDVFWPLRIDRYGRSVFGEGLEVPCDADPYEYLAMRQGYDGWMVHRDKPVTILSEQPSRGVVPILCLHRLGDGSRYELTPERFKKLLGYINANGWYLVADYQYLGRDLSHVPTGLKPMVMGADDASYGNLIYKTYGDEMYGKVKRFFGKPMLESNSMVAILKKYAKQENDRINFTFYISFDAIPFRQLDGYKNPGFPYAGIPVVMEKIQYLDKHFRVGIHSLSHIYAHDMGASAFAQDVLNAWILIDDYSGGRADTLQTMAFPYGINPLTAELHQAVSSLTHHGRHLVGGFDFDNQFASAPGIMKEPFDVSRYNVDNANWEKLMDRLDGVNAVVARREIVLETHKKRLPGSRWRMGATPSDNVWILVRN